MTLGIVNALNSLKNSKELTIQFGNWEGEPIEWIILKEVSFGILITTRYSICGKMPFDQSNNSNWSSSSVRAFLNKVFWKKSFTDNEKKHVINVFLNDVNTKDNVFLISKDESDNYLSNSEVNARGYWCTRTKANDY